MSKSDTFENDLLKLIFNSTPIANMADNAGSAPLGNLFIALHTADPGEAGVQSTSEVTYTGYARAQVARTTSGWTVGQGQVNPANTINFGQRTDSGATQTATFFSVGVALSGATKILYSGAINPTITINQNTTPQLTTATIITED